MLIVPEKMVTRLQQPHKSLWHIVQFSPDRCHRMRQRYKERSSREKSALDKSREPMTQYRLIADLTSTPLHPVEEIAELIHAIEHFGRPPLE